MVKTNIALLAAAASLAANGVHAAPATTGNTATDALSLIDGTSSSLQSLAGKLLGGIENWMHGATTATNAKETAEEWFEGMRIVKDQLVDGLRYDVLTHPAHPEYRLRVTSSKEGGHDTVSPTICDPDVKQISGYLDIEPSASGGYGKHLFFWFFESRSSPSTDPLLLWLNGGPGCSSTTGLLFELGPCQIADKGSNVTYNKHSWTEKANVIFLDQPVGVGYSYSDAPDGMGIDNSPAAAADVYAFLTLFVGKFDKYRKNPFHISGESYAGTYLPNIAHVIHENNKKLEAGQSVSTASSSEVALRPVPKLPVLNFKSVLIGNGLTEAATQFSSVPEYACDSKYAVYDDPEGSECASLRSKMERCRKVAESCYNVSLTRGSEKGEAKRQRGLFQRGGRKLIAVI